jgi:hypothetical protein
VVEIISNDNGTVLALGGTSKMDDVYIQAECTAREVGDYYNPSFPATCEITGVYVEISEGYNQFLDLGKLHDEINDWEEAILDELATED